MKVFNSDVSVGSKAPLYEHVGRTMRQLKTTNFSEGGDSREQDIDKILVTMLISHLCDHLKIRDKITLFHTLHDSTEVDFKDSEFLMLVKAYFTNKEMKITNSINQAFKTIIFYDPNIKSKENKAVYYVNYGTSSWKLAEIEDKKDIQTYLNNNIRNLDKVTPSNTFGFMGTVSLLPMTLLLN